MNSRQDKTSKEQRQGGYIEIKKNKIIKKVYSETYLSKYEPASGIFFIIIITSLINSTGFHFRSISKKKKRVQISN